jgi:hypothetical protein
LTNFFGRISPEAETLDTRSFLETLPVWTSTFFRFSRATLPAMTPPTTATARTDSAIFLPFDMNPQPPEMRICFKRVPESRSRNGGRDPPHPWSPSKRLRNLKMVGSKEGDLTFAGVFGPTLLGSA